MKYIALLMIILFSLSILGGVLAQTKDTTIKGTESELEEIRKRIKDTKTKQEQKKKEESSVLRQMDVINQRIRARDRELSILQSRLRKNETETQKLQRELQETQGKLNQYQTYLAGRIRSIYRANKESPYQQILSATNYIDEIRNTRYERTLAYADAKYVSSTRMQSNQLNRQKFNMNELIREQKIQQTEVSRSKKQYQGEQKQKSTLLTKIKNDKVLLEKTVKDYESAARRLEQLLAELRVRQQQFPDVIYGGPIAESKGKLTWPVSSGSVIYGPGEHKHPELGIAIYSKGIGIRSTKGADVYAVHEGIVRYSSWLEGSGNTIILEHGQQYLTLYMHLNDISVQKGQVVQQRQRIGGVGDTGSLEGVQLEFQIRKGTSSMNPLDWLVKR